jgi:hypothetical protein
VAERAASPAHQALVAHYQSVSYLRHMRVSRAELYAERALVFVERDPHGVARLAGYELRPRCHSMRSSVCRYRVQVAEALQHAERSLASLADRGDDLAHALALSARGHARLLLGSGEAGLADARESVELFEHAGYGIAGQPNLLEALRVMGDPRALLKVAQNADAAASTAGRAVIRAQTARYLAEARAGVGEHEAARAAADEAVALALQIDSNPALALLARARVALASAEPSAADAIAADLEQGLEAARADGVALAEAQLLEASAALATLRGDGAAREQALREALAIWERGGAIGPAERVRRALASTSA